MTGCLLLEEQCLRKRATPRDVRTFLQVDRGPLDGLIAFSSVSLAVEKTLPPPLNGD